MKKKNELDVLFNGNDELVKDLAQRPVLNEKESKKMFEMSKKKLEEKSNLTASEKTEYTSGESVQGVENYRRSIIFRRVLSAASCILLIGGIAGTVFLLNKHKEIIGDTNVIDHIGTTTGENNDNTSKTTIVSSSGNEANVTSVTTTTSSTDIQTTSKEYTTPAVYEKDFVNNAALTYMANFTARYDILCMNIEYSLVDLNKDNVPELLISCENMVCSNLFICTYDGHQYNYVTPKTSTESVLINFYVIKISTENGLICTSGKNCPTLFLRVNSDNTVELLDKLFSWWDYESDDIGYWRNDEKITKDEYDSITSTYNAYNWSQPEFTFYAEHNGYMIDDPPSLYTDINIDKLIEYGELPSIGERELCVVYDRLIPETVTDNLDLFDPDIENTGGVAGEEYSSTSGTITDIYPHFGQGRKLRLRVDILDRGDEQRHNLIAADVDFATGECNILQNKYPDALNMHF